MAEDDPFASALAVAPQEAVKAVKGLVETPVRQLEARRTKAQKGAVG